MFVRGDAKVDRIVEVISRLLKGGWTWVALAINIVHIYENSLLDLCFLSVSQINQAKFRIKLVWSYKNIGDTFPWSDCVYQDGQTKL